MHYYYDDDGSKGDHWKNLGNITKEEAIKKFQELLKLYKVKPAILYNEDMKTIIEEK